MSTVMMRLRRAGYMSDLIGRGEVNPDGYRFIYWSRDVAKLRRFRKSKLDVDTEGVTRGHRISVSYNILGTRDVTIRVQ